MNRKAIIFSILILFSYVGSSQNKIAKLEWGRKFKSARQLEMKEVISYDDKGVFILKAGRRNFFNKKQIHVIEHFDKGMNPLNSRIVELDNSKSQRFEFVVDNDKELLLFYSSFNAETNKVQLMARSLSKETLQQNGASFVVLDTKFGKEIFNYSKSYNCIYSRDSSKILIHSQVPYPYEKENELGLFVAVYDRDFQMQWDREIIIGGRASNFKLKKFSIDKEGNLAFLSKKDFFSNNQPSKYFAYTMKANASEVFAFPLQGAEYITDLSLELTNKQDVVCAGFYSEQSVNSVKGSYFTKIDFKTGKQSIEKLRPFDSDFILENLSNYEVRVLKKKLKGGLGLEIPNCRLRNAYLRIDGGILLIGEENYFYQKTSQSSNQGILVREIFNYNDIVIVNIDPDGEIAWTRKVPKRQVSVNDGGYMLSFASSVIDGKLHLIFNDDPKNLDIAPNDRIRYYTKFDNTCLTLASIDTQGGMDKQFIYNKKQAKVIVRPFVCKQISKNEMIVYGEKGRIEQFGLLRFGE